MEKHMLVMTRRTRAILLGAAGAIAVAVMAAPIAPQHAYPFLRQHAALAEDATDPGGQGEGDFQHQNESQATDPGGNESSDASSEK
jgi:hypothetical protein